MPSEDNEEKVVLVESIITVAPESSEQSSSTTTMSTVYRWGYHDVDDDDNDDSGECRVNDRMRKGNAVRQALIIMMSQLGSALTLFIMGHIVLKQWARNRCPHHLGLRPPPVSYDAETGAVVLVDDLNHPFKPDSTISATTLWITAVWIPLIGVGVSAWLLSLYDQHNELGNDNDDDDTDNNAHERHKEGAKDEKQRASSRSSSFSSSLVSSVKNAPLVSCPRFMRRPLLTLVGLMEIVAATSGFVTTMGVVEALTRLAKALVGRRRPNFYQMCYFDAATATCTSGPGGVCQASYSFPSGHSSMSAAGMMFLTCYLAGKILSRKCQLQHKRFWCVLQAILLLGWTLVVGWTRVLDYWHQGTDVMAGLLLGTTMAITVYHLYFPVLWNKNNTAATGTPRFVWIMFGDPSKMTHQVGKEVPV